VLLDGDLHLTITVTMNLTRRYATKWIEEKDVRHKLMQHIIDSREGIMNTTSTHYEYFEDKKRTAKYLSESDPRETVANAKTQKE
jgi:hypothetical protein